MNINYKNSTIEMTATEAKAAGKLNSEKFLELKELKASEPSFRVVIVKSSIKKGDRFKGLNLDYMRNYINNHDQRDSILPEFYELCGLDKEGNKQQFATRASYGEIKLWFLAKYPEVKNLGANIDRIIAEAKRQQVENKAIA